MRKEEMVIRLFNNEDEYTKGHSVRVATVAKEIAKRSGMSVEKQDEIYYMGILHDNGKTKVNSSILNKPSKLTDVEYKEIKNHTRYGWENLKNFPEMKNFAAVARWHHERYDGNGYPDRLKGEEIPDFVRIISIADAYDAMAENRCYRTKLQETQIIEEIEKGKGTQFDPYYAEVMVDIIDEKKIAKCM